MRARRAILLALSQEDYMRAYVGDDDSLWKPLPGFFTPGTPLYTEEASVISQAAMALAYPGRGCGGTGYVEGCSLLW